MRLAALGARTKALSTQGHSCDNAVDNSKCQLEANVDSTHRFSVVSVMKSSSALLVFLSLLAVACGERDPRDIPYSEFSTSDSAAGTQVLMSMTEEEKELMMIGFMAFARDTVELRKQSINMLIEKGREIQGTESR